MIGDQLGRPTQTKMLMAHTIDTSGEVNKRPDYWGLSGIGFIFAALFIAASLTPSLVPREPLMQGVLSGVTGAVGYCVGALVMWIWRIMELPVASGRAALIFRIVFHVIGLAIVAGALSQAAEWQNATRAVMDLEPVATSHPFTVAGVTAVVFALLWSLGSVFMFVVRRLGRMLERVLPGRVGPVLGLLVGIWFFWALIDGILIRNVLEIADAGFAAGEQVFAPGEERPTDPLMTGSSASLVSWEDLGNRGRDFVARTPEPEEIAQFSGEGALRPVRVYVGRVSADDARARAELALEELIRVGGFEREILIITTPVGTGWMDPGSHDVIDFMFGGDTAHVGAQYSYLTSVLSIITNVQYGIDQARELFDVIYGYWAQLPEGDRPRLYIHGLSQGALNSQATLRFLDVLGEPFDGAFWAGSPFISPLWSQVRQRRNVGSPAWRPRYGNGSLIRTTNQDNVLDDALAPWGPIRMVFLNYGSDPLVAFDFATLWRKPAWLEEPRAPDVAPEMRWYPLVTALQLGLDMMGPLGVEGYGHFYVYEDYIDAWAELTDPPDWSEERADALRTLFDQRPAPW